MNALQRNDMTADAVLATDNIYLLLQTVDHLNKRLSRRPGPAKQDS
jgi:hypothetical protein